MRGLSEKVVIIAGGLGDLGFASGKRVAEEGFSAALLDRKLIEVGHCRLVALVGRLIYWMNRRSRMCAKVSWKDWDRLASW